MRQLGSIGRINARNYIKTKFQELKDGHSDSNIVIKEEVFKQDSHHITVTMI